MERNCSVCSAALFRAVCLRVGSYWLVGTTCLSLNDARPRIDVGTNADALVTQKTKRDTKG